MSERTIFHERLEWLGPNSDNASRKSDKFYEVTVTSNGGRGFTETRRWGRWGSKGQTKVIRHSYEWGALDSARRQLRKKRDKGYTAPVAPLKRLASLAEDDS